jgi:hypothetical protein
MHTPPPESGKPPAIAGDGVPPVSGGSTGSHRSQQPDSLSDVLRSHSSSSRTASPIDVLSRLPLNTDDSPTVITSPGKSSSPPPPPPPHVVGDQNSIAGRKLGHFELIEAIGAGGMAAVLKARDLELGRIVALKILPPESALDPENVNRFKQEARAAAKLDHDNVARVYFCGEDQGLHFIAFEFVEGITLRQAIDWRGPVRPADAVPYMIQVAAGLAHAAERGVVHRDIKPSNILITPDGKAKIVDMGLARHLESQSVNGGVTQSGVTLGTFDYISPEQALDPRQADVRSDIYSLGCTFYHALTGRPPVGEGTAAKKLHDHQHVDPLDPRDLNSKIPDELAAVLSRMMAKDPSRRYQTPAELIASLKAVAERLRISLDVVARDSTVKAVAADHRVLPALPRVRMSWVVAGAAVVAAVVAIVVAAARPDFGNAAPWWAKETQPTKPDPHEPLLIVPKVPADERSVASAEALAAALADSNTTKIRLAAGSYDLTTLPKSVSFHGPELEMIGSVNPPTVLRIALPTGKRSEERGSLTLTAAAVKLSGIRFDIVADESGIAEPGSDHIGLALLDAATVELTDCLFFPDGESKKLAAVSVAVDNTAGETAIVKLTRCLFAPGWIGIRIPSRAGITTADSGFGPHFSAIQIHGDARPADEPAPAAGSTNVQLERSSFILDSHSAAVDVDESATLNAAVSASYCVFASGNSTTPDSRGGIVRNSTRKRTTKLTPEQKCAWYGVQPSAGATKPVPFEDANWLKLARRPWDSGTGLLAAFSGEEPWTAFKLALTGSAAEPAVFESPYGVLGAQFHSRDIRRTYVDVVWPPRPPVVEITTRVWWPKAPAAEDRPPIYSDLHKLLRDANPGDTVLIRHDGPLAMEPCTIQRSKEPDRNSFHITFKPENKDLHPALMLSPDDSLESTLFNVKHGKITFEDLHFDLKPGPSQDRLAAVRLVAGRECTFKNCTFTLDEYDGKVAAAVVLFDPSGVMKMEGSVMSTLPKIDFEGCLLRGKGRALVVPVSRPFNLEMDNTITALNGPVIQATNAAKELGAGNASTVHLSRVTALLAGPFIELQAGSIGVMKGSGLVPTIVKADKCLFAAVPGAGSPIIDVTGADLDRMDPNRVLRWEAIGANRYMNFETTPAAVVRPDANTNRMWTWTDWVPFAQEVAAGRTVGKAEFADGPDGVKDLATFKPADAQVKKVDLPDLPTAEPGETGADPQKVAVPPAAAKSDSPDDQPPSP